MSPTSCFDEAVKNWIIPFVAGRTVCRMGVCLLAICASSIFAATVTLRPIADTSLYEDNPTNNLGGEFALPVGGAYRIDEPRATVNRGLFKFNVAGALPAGVEITSVRLVMKVVQVPSPPEGPATNSIFELRRMLRDWGEGNKRAVTNASSQAKNGALATAGEATWNARFVPNQLWNVPGGSAGVDYDLVNSGEVFVRALGTYAVESNPNMIADVQGWLDKPVSNFGWMLRSQSELTRYTNRRFASREDTNNAPALTIEFRDPGELRFASVALAGNRVTFSFAAKAGQSYAVEFSVPLTPGSWSTLTNFPVQSAAGDLTASDSLASPFRFYRLRTPGN